MLDETIAALEFAFDALKASPVSSLAITIFEATQQSGFGDAPVTPLELIGLCDVDFQKFNDRFWGNELASWPIS